MNIYIYIYIYIYQHYKIDASNKNDTQQKRHLLIQFEKNGTLQKWQIPHMKWENIAPTQNGGLQKL